MWRSEDPAREQLPDVKRFLNLLNGTPDLFVPDAPLYVARAPGRLDLMGGIADYSGALVLEMPLEVAVLVAVQRVNEPFVTITSTEAGEIGGTSKVVLPLETLRQLDERSAHEALTAKPEDAWAAYVAGVLVVLRQKYALSREQGMRIVVHSEVPIGKGVSSSAALEVATMQAVCALAGLSLAGREVAILCQRVENFIVGAPCGIMDQMTSACGTQNALLALLCQPAELQGVVPLPEEIEIWGIDSGVRHAVSGSDYGGVRVGAFIGYRLIADLAGLQVSALQADHLEIADPRWQGYLANISPSEWETAYRDRLPLEIKGADFLARYGGLTDRATRVDPARTYAVRQPTAHPIYEHHRVRLFRALLASPQISEEVLALLGELMYQSHASYSACGLGSAGTDRLVELVRLAGPRLGLYGAKITGGGSGGTVAVLARRGAQEQVAQIVTTYKNETGLDVSLLHGSSPGSVEWGALRLCIRP